MTKGADRAYQLVLDATGKIVDVARAGATPAPRRYPAEGATIYYTTRGTPKHVCYDDPRRTHPDDRPFCATRKAF
jgi:hypothetical protein